MRYETFFRLLKHNEVGASSKKEEDAEEEKKLA